MKEKMVELIITHPENLTAVYGKTGSAQILHAIDALCQALRADGIRSKVIRLDGSTSPRWRLVTQRLVLRAMAEAAEAGISTIVLVLAPGMAESLYSPLNEALRLAVVPPLRLHSVEQARPEGLGEAVLHAEAVVGNKPFAVILPDDVLRERADSPLYAQELYRMVEAFRGLDPAHLVAVAPVIKSKMPSCGVVEVDVKGAAPRIFPVLRLVEKPDTGHELCHHPHTRGIVGRYLLRPGIFAPLRALKEEGKRPVHLTDALERLRAAGETVYGFELKAKREHLGEVLEEARGWMEEEVHSRKVIRLATEDTENAGKERTD